MDKPESDWCDIQASFERGTPELVCRQCQEKGIPSQPYFDLKPEHLVAMTEITRATDIKTGLRNAAAASGLDEDYIRKKLLTGRRVPEFRRLFQFWLEAKGMDVVSCITAAVAAMKADEIKYHSGEEVFYKFPDHRTRLRAAQWGVKMLEGEPPKTSKGNATRVNVVMQTNLVAGSEVDPPGTMRAKAATAIVDVTPDG